MNQINKRYNIGLSIINNNGGVKAMLNDIIKPSRIIKSYKIFNRLKSIINKVFENVGYFFIGYKVDIEQNQSDILEAKAKIRILRNTQSHNIEDIETLTKYVSKKFVKIELEMANIEQIKTLTKDVDYNHNEILTLASSVKVLKKYIKKAPAKKGFNSYEQKGLYNLLFTTNNKMLNDCSKELISFIIDANRYEDNINIKDVNNILRKHINLTNERGQDGTE